jgi:hypothetical protein
MRHLLYAYQFKIICLGGENSLGEAIWDSDFTSTRSACANLAYRLVVWQSAPFALGVYKLRILSIWSLKTGVFDPINSVLLYK